MLPRPAAAPEPFVARDNWRPNLPKLSIDAPAPISRHISNHPAALAERLAPARDLLDGRDTASLAFDTVMERHVRIVPLTDDTLPRVRAFAHVSDAAMAAVLWASTTDGVAWTEAPSGLCLADSGEALTPSEVGLLRHVLSRLHQAGAAHGSVDREHLYRGQTGLCLAFPRELLRDATATDDLRSLEALAR